jgi:homocysteine S-methyltransferase
VKQSFASWLEEGPWPIDGGLSGELEKRGHDLSDKLWSARLLRDAPEAIAQVHQDYVNSGGRVLITASYQASRMGFVATGMTADQADDLMRLSISLAKDVAAKAPEKVWVAASVGPYGAVLGGGQEYVGNYGVAHIDLVKFHRERIAVLASAKPDLFACETIPDLDEVRALVEVLADYPDIPAWITMSAQDGNSTCAGQGIGHLAELVSKTPSVVAVGVNCTKPEFVSSLLRQLATKTSLPLVVYPNAGRVWDGLNMCWIGEGHDKLPKQIVSEWVKAGAKLIGGCCGLGPDAITQLDSDLVQIRNATAK